MCKIALITLCVVCIKYEFAKQRIPTWAAVALNFWTILDVNLSFLAQLLGQITLAKLQINQENPLHSSPGTVFVIIVHCCQTATNLYSSRSWTTGTYSDQFANIGYLQACCCSFHAYLFSYFSLVMEWWRKKQIFGTNSK